MKFVCLQENFKRDLNIAQNIIGRNLTLPILNNLLLQTEEGRLKISATNLEIGVNTWTSGKVEKDGAITCPARILASLVNNLPNKKVELEVKGNNLLIKCENFKTTIKGLPADDFPIIPKIKEAPLMEAENGLFKDALNQVVGVTALSESRPEIAGVLFSFERNDLRLAATDSFRLAEKVIFFASKKPDAKKTLIVPQRTAQELIRILGEREGKVKIVLGHNQVLFDMGEAQLVSRLIEGQYPDYQQIIPKSFNYQVGVERELLLNSVRVAGIFSSKVNNITLVLKKGQLEVLSNDADLGENRSQVPAEIKGGDLSVNFNYRYILDGLTNISSKKVFLGMNSESSPMVIRPAGEDDYLYIIMPIKAN